MVKSYSLRCSWVIKAEKQNGPSRQDDIAAAKQPSRHSKPGKKICGKLIIQIKTDQDSTVFWYLPHLLQISQASAARDSWTALIVGEHIYFERLVGSFESPSNTFFFSVSLVLMNTTNFYRPTLLRRRALQQIASFWRLEKFFFSLFLKNQMSDAFLKEGSEAEVSTANEPHQLKFIKVTPWSWFKMRRTMSWATHWEKRQTSEIGQDIFCVLILVYFVEWLLNVILILRVNSVIYSIVESLWNDISLSLLHAWMTAICLSLV